MSHKALRTLASATAIVVALTMLTPMAAAVAGDATSASFNCTHWGI